MLYVRGLVWDPANVAHIARHGITQLEVEEVCHGRHAVRQSYLQRIMLIGPTKSGRMIVIVLAPKDDGVYYTVTARPASRRERTLYAQEVKARGDQKDD